MFGIVLALSFITGAILVGGARTGKVTGETVGCAVVGGAWRGPGVVNSVFMSEAVGGVTVGTAFLVTCKGSGKGVDVLIGVGKVGGATGAHEGSGSGSNVWKGNSFGRVIVGEAWIGTGKGSHFGSSGTDGSVGRVVDGGLFKDCC